MNSHPPDATAMDGNASGTPTATAEPGASPPDPGPAPDDPGSATATAEPGASPPDPGPAPENPSRDGGAAVHTGKEPASVVPPVAAVPPLPARTRAARRRRRTGALGLGLVALAGVLLVVSLATVPWHRPDCESAAPTPEPDMPLLLVASALEDPLPGIRSGDCGDSISGILTAAFASGAVVLTGIAVRRRTRMTASRSVSTRRAIVVGVMLAAVALGGRLWGPGNVGADRLPGNDLALWLMVVAVAGALLVLRSGDSGSGAVGSGRRR